MSLTGQQRDILDELVPYEWRTVLMERIITTPLGRTRMDRIRGQRPQLKVLNDLGLVEVRTMAVSYWFSPKSDRPRSYSEQYVEAVLTAQGMDVRDGRS